MIRIKKTNRGDTIVEVVVSMAILAFALGAAYVLGNKSLSTAIDANQRREATAIMQGQIQLIKNGYKTDPSFSTDYQRAADYCVNISGGVTSIVNANQAPCYNPGATSYDGTQYRTFTHYNSVTKTFTIEVYWNNVNGRGPAAGPNQNPSLAPGQSIITAYYRTPV